MRNEITRKELHDIFNVVRDEIRSSINVTGREISGAELAIGKLLGLIQGTMENEPKEFEDIVIERIRSRQKEGLEKYGVSVREETDTTFKEWLTHLQDELLDASIYIERLKEESLPYRVYADSERLGLSDYNKCMATFRNETQAHKFGRMMWDEFYEIRRH